MLGQLNKILAVPLTRDDVEGVYAGLRPLLAGESESTSKLSREHTVAHPVPGLVLIAGGKYTTYRVMARDAVDAVAHGLDGKVAPSCTDSVPLAGADGFIALWNARHALARSSGLHVARIEHLLHRYGSLISEVLELIAADPSLGKPLAGADDYLRAEIVYAASHEGARHLDDVLARRTHASIETWDRGLSAAEEAATLMAGPDEVEVPPGRPRARELPRRASRPSAPPRKPTPTRTPTRSASAPPTSSRSSTATPSPHSRARVTGIHQMLCGLAQVQRRFPDLARGALSCTAGASHVTPAAAPGEPRRLRCRVRPG